MKKHLLKSLLVGAAMVLGATGAQAQTVTTYDFEDGKALFTADSRIGATVVEGSQTIYSTDFAIDGKAVYFTGAGNAQNGYCFAHYDFSSLCNQAAKVKVEFDAVLGNGARSRITIGDAAVRGNGSSICSKTKYGSNGAIFMIGTEKSAGYLNGTNNGGLLTGLTQKWLKVTVEVDEIAKTYTYSIANKETNEVLYSNGEEPISFWQSDATNCTQIDVFGYINNSQIGLIDNLVITVTKDEREQADYTVKFVDSANTEIKDAVKRSGAVGDAITLLPADKDPFWNTAKTQKYYYDSDDTEGKTILGDGSTVVTVTYRDATTFAWTLNATDGTDVLKQLGTGEGIEGETSYVSYPRMFLQNEQLYACTPTTNAGKATAYGYQTSFTAAGEKAITYAVVDSIAAFYECEDLALVGSFAELNGYATARYSNGRAPRLSNGSYVYTPTIDPGIYNVYLWCRNNNGSNAYSIPLYLRDYKGDLTKADDFPEWAKSACTWNVIENVTINSNTSLAIKNDGSSTNLEIDYIFIVKKGDVEADSELMAEAKSLAADNDAVAVGKLRDAIAAAEESGDESGLQAAIDQFKADNADQEKDQTGRVGIAAASWTGASGLCATQYAPAITTYDGRTAQLVENYNGSTGTVTGKIFYQTITGLVNGAYKVGFYANAFSTADRDKAVETGMEDGADDVAYVYANENQKFIVAHRATSTTENGFYTFDVDVTDGQIELGMAKAKEGTNWHTLQIYQLTWFTTAKAVYAADKATMTEAIATAEALAADEEKTEGKDELNAAIEAAKAALANNKLNITEFETEIATLNTAIAAFKAANYVALTGEFYIFDAETGLGMAAGHDWGTRGIVEGYGLDFTLTANESNRVTIDSQVSNSGNNHFLGENLYMDSSAFAWALEKKGTNYYITNGTQFISVDGSNNLVMSDEAREWTIQAKADVIADRMATLAAATTDNGVDATWLLQNPNFNRNDLRVSAWTVSEDCTNKNLNGGNNENNCAESYHSTFTISQVVADAPKGSYTLTAQGFYRQDEGKTEETPVFFIGDKTAEVPVKTGDEGSMSAASVSFTNGLYTIEPIKFYFNGESDLTIGVKGTATSQWVIFDNFQLTYFGEEDITTGINEVTVKGQNAEAVYNLAGQKVQQTVKGLYIVGGKKVVIK